MLPVRREGTAVVGFPGGMRLRLDLRESIQRDFLFGVYDRHELALVRSRLGDGDFVDVGAHVGLYSISAALALRARGRVLAFEPNPAARAQLEANLALNGCDNVVVRPCAVGAEAGRAILHVPATPDPSFSSLEAGRFPEGEPHAVDVTTVDRAVAEHGLRPSVVKIDVEGAELGVLAGMERTLEAHPALVIEVGPATAEPAERALAERGYRAFAFRRGRLREGLAGRQGMFNAVFLPG